jgi:hypothetical protein
MQEYEIRKGLQGNIEPDKLKASMLELFGNVQEKDGKLVSSYGALKELHAWPAKKALGVETVMDTTVSNEVAAETIKVYNAFLEKVTGYTAKERGKRAQKKAKEGKL